MSDRVVRMGPAESAAALQQEYYVATAPNYDSWHGEDSAHQIAVRHMMAYTDALSVQTLLDVGCGTGRVLQFLRDQRPQITLQGLEPVPALAEQALAKGIPVGTIQIGRGESLPWPSQSIDAVSAFGVLHHVPDPQAVVSEMLRVAKKAVFISDSNRFGQGGWTARRLKLCLFRWGLWPLANYLKTRGRGYTHSAEDGLAYSYSVYDSLGPLQQWAQRLVLVDTGSTKSPGLQYPLLAADHLLVCALREDPA